MVRAKLFMLDHLPSSLGSRYKSSIEESAEIVVLPVNRTSVFSHARGRSFKWIRHKSGPRKEL